MGVVFKLLHVGVARKAIGGNEKKNGRDEILDKMVQNKMKKKIEKKMKKMVFRGFTV